MPNWVTVKIVVESDDPALLRYIQKDCRGENGAVDFNKIVPMPEDSPDFKATGDFSDEDREHYKAGNWYDWSIANWGTKWNAADSSSRVTDGKLTLRFQTAWSAPHPVAAALHVQYRVRLRMSWFDEDFGSNCGYVQYDPEKEDVESSMPRDFAEAISLIDREFPGKPADVGLSRLDGGWTDGAYLYKAGEDARPLHSVKEEEP